MALSTLDGDFVQVNDKLAAMLGYTIDELSLLGVHGSRTPTTSTSTWSGQTSSGTGEIDSYRREKGTSAATARSCGRS